MLLKKITAAATALMFLFTIGCGDDPKPRANQPWPSSAPAAEVTTHAVEGISSKDFSLDLVYAKISKSMVEGAMQDPGELQTWIGNTSAVNTGVDINPTNGSLDAIMVSMETIGNSQCFVLDAVEESTVDNPFNVGRVCVSETETGEVAIQATYPEHVQGYQDHSYHRHYPRSHFGSGFIVGAALAAIMLSHRPGFGGGYWGGGGGWGHRPVMSMSQRTTVRTTHITNKNVVAPKAKTRPKNTKPSKAATRTASKFANKGGAKAGRPGDKNMASRKGHGTQFKKGSTNPVKKNDSFLSKKSAAGGSKRAPMPERASVAKRRDSGALPQKGQKPSAAQGGRKQPSKSRPSSKSRPAKAVKSSRSRPSSKPRRRRKG